jgi:GTP cyclohydrolase FolE2
MNAPDRAFLPDVQALADHRAIAIDRVGVKSIRHPIDVRRADGSVLSTVASVDMTVALEATVKGTHMSRFLEVLEAQQGPLDAAAIRALFASMLTRLGAEAGRIDMAFPFFLRKLAPVSGVASLMDYDVTWSVSCAPGGVVESRVKVLVPVTSLCPCSREISNYGAHNQRSHIIIEALSVEDLAPEDLIAIAEAQASCQLWGLLKRPDEKYVTEYAYDNPKFVEDLVRDVAVALERDARVLAYSLSSENFESIHNHSAWAEIRRDKRVAR